MTLILFSFKDACEWTQKVFRNNTKSNYHLGTSKCYDNDILDCATEEVTRFGYSMSLIYIIMQKTKYEIEK